MAVEITSRKELEAWLEDKPLEWRPVIALRCALRSLPLAIGPNTWEEDGVNTRSIAVMFRALTSLSFVKGASTKDLPQSIAVHEANSSIGLSVRTSDRYDIFSQVAASVFAAGRTLTDRSGAAVAANHTANAAVLFARAAATDTAIRASAVDADTMIEGAVKKARLAVWEAVGTDCEVLSKGQSLLALSLTSIWPSAPHWWSEAWSGAARWLSRPEDNFAIWREWYYGRLEGLPHAFADFDNEADEAFYNQIIEYDDDWWSREPREVNADIKALVDSLRKPKDTSAEPVDFFISYANEDEAAAREVAAVLDELGKSYLVQYRDFAQVNWVNAIDDALERSERLIPIYSKHYIASDHCKTEWNHFYKLDPSGVERRIVGFKLDGADLRPLMDQIVYKDLSSVDRAERAQTIHDWITWTPPKLNRDNVEKTLTTHLDPGIVASKDGKLDTAPDPVLNETDVPAELARAMDALRMMLDLARMTERNLSSMMQGTLKLYDDHFSERGRKSSWGGLDRYMAVLAEGAADLSSATMREEKAALEQLIAAHGKCMAALNSIDEQMRELAHIPIENVDPQAIEGLIDRLKEVQDQAREQEASTEEFDKQAGELVGQGRDFAHAAGAVDAEQKPDNARKRFLRYVGGFGMRTLAVLGSLASIRQTPEFKRLIEAAELLVEEFFDLLGL